MRIVAILGGAAALGLALWLFVLPVVMPSGPTDEPLKTIKPLHPVKKAGLVPTAPAKAAQKPAGPAKAKPAAPAPARPTKPARPKASTKRAVPNPNGLPLAIARALARHPVVVVSLYSPEAKVDGISLGEAAAGAKLAGSSVGFVALNVLDQRQSLPLTRKLGVLSNPAVFVYRRPGNLVMRFDGFADRDLVAQAAVAALPPGVAARRAAAKK
jgi:hypothetical protein